MMRHPFRHIPHLILSAILTIGALLIHSDSYAEESALNDLIQEALEHSPEIKAAKSRAAASQFRVSQAGSLPDPMIMFGYQNEGFKSYTYGEMPDSQWMFSASQMFPFPGKRPIKSEMAARESESFGASAESVKLKTVARIKELYYDLFLVHKNIGILKDKTALFSRIEDAAVARYASGIGMQQEVLMAQTEKYMFLEKEEMFNQKIQSYEAMLNSTIGRDITAPLGKPAELTGTPYDHTLDELIKHSVQSSPDIKLREKMIASSESKVRMAEREYYPDFTLNASYFARGGEFDDMWSLTTTFNIPLFYRAKQRQAVREAEASLGEVRSELEATKLMLSSAIRDNYSMLRTAERLMELYKNALVPKGYQDYEAALAGYVTGRIEALTVITRLKALLDFEILYWVQFVEREKAIARIEALTGGFSQGSGGLQ